ncbi:MAG: type II toxin-antitoxin system RelE/ParE family toxin [Candidatus Rokubacteria bacterium]|nr:type II toxin-antitoxin system RelE/ParE family toxin [Candidatus Rokubacteria bacterium]
MRRLPRGVQELVDIEVARLAMNPRHAGARAMRDEWRGYWRVRAGVYRVIYEIHHPRLVLVAKIGPRGSIYDRDRPV